MPSVLTAYPSRLATAPTLRVTDATPERAVVRIEGLVCALCAARTQQALAAVPGVEAARVDLEAGTAELRYALGSTPDEEALRRALASVVIGGAMRRWIERVAHLIGVRR